MIKFVKATEEDAEYITENLRESDQRECILAGVDPEMAPINGFMDSDFCITAMADGVPMLIFGGIIPKNGGARGIIWALGTELCRRHAREMVQLGREVCKVYLGLWPCWANIVPVESRQNLKWLKMIGFSVLKESVWQNGSEFKMIILEEK